MPEVSVPHCTNRAWLKCRMAAEVGLGHASLASAVRLGTCYGSEIFRRPMQIDWHVHLQLFFPGEALPKMIEHMRDSKRLASLLKG